MQKLLLVSILIIGTLVRAQNCDLTLSGKIEDQHDDSALSNALISIVDTDIYTYSNDQGDFYLDRKSTRLNPVTL